MQASVFPLLMILLHLVCEADAWAPNSEPNIDRRQFHSWFGATASAAAGGNLLLTQQSAYAKEPISTVPTSFDAYSIIADPSASLDPQLRKVDVSRPARKVVLLP